VYLLARAIEQAGTDRREVRDYVAEVGGTQPAFDGVTGRIAFDRHGDVPAKPVVIGVVRSGRLVTERAP
jgi:ABC-type branched-subunit amino acid transport system substrate-binding protein